jgi:hypothetical protein
MRNVRVSAVRFGKQLAIRCPFCGEVHLHGAIGPALGAGDGLRSPHCVRGPGTQIGHSVALTEVSAKTYVRRQLQRLGFTHGQVTELLERAAGR